MASNFNMKCAHKDGKSQLTIGVDENSKTIEGINDELIIKNKDGSAAKISKENIPGMPDDVSEENKLITQKDLQEMFKNISDIMDSAGKLAEIVGLNLKNGGKE